MTENNDDRDPGDSLAPKGSVYLPRSIIDWLTGDGSGTPDDDEAQAETKEPIS